MLGNVADVAQKEAVAALQKALQSGDVEGAGKAWQQVINSISDKVKTDCEMYNTNQKVLARIVKIRKCKRRIYFGNTDGKRSIGKRT